MNSRLYDRHPAPISFRPSGFALAKPEAEESAFALFHGTRVTEHENTPSCSDFSTFDCSTSFSPFVTHSHSPRATFLCFQSLAHSFARSNSTSLLFSISSALFAQNTRGVVSPLQLRKKHEHQHDMTALETRQIVRCAGLADCGKMKLPAEAATVPKRQPAGGSLQFRGNGLLEKEGQMP